MKYRNKEYWKKVVSNANDSVIQLSKKLEKERNWKKDYPFIKFIFVDDEQDESPYIHRVDDACEIIFNKGFLKWLDEPILDIALDEEFSNSFELVKSQTISDISYWIQNQWISWFLYHEVGHFICGHLTGKSKIWEEWTSYEHMKLSAKTKLAYEYDADIFAAQTYFRALANMIKSPSGSYKFDTNDFIKDIGFIFFAFFVYIGRKNPTNNSHPVAQDRMMIFLRIGFVTLQRFLSRNVDKEMSIFKSGFMESLSCIGDEGLNFTKFNWSNVSSKLKENREELLNNKLNERRLSIIDADWLRFNYLSSEA